MADRSIKVVLRANVEDFKKQMLEASKAAGKLGENIKLDEAESKLGRLGQSLIVNREKWAAAGKATLAFSTALGVVGLKSVQTAADFDQAMSNVQAATHESTQNMDLLREAALQAGADTAFSAVEAASGIEELAKAGVSTTDILSGGLRGALDMAAAGQMEVGAAAELAATAMTQFRLSGDQIPHVADLLAAGAGKAQGSMSDLGYALKQAGLVASNTGLSLEETTGTLAAFASAGLIGSDAGTSFKSMLQRLQNPTKSAKKLLDAYNISLYDSQGQFVGMANLAGQMHDAFANLTPAVRDAALAQIFGSDAVRAANVIWSEGAEGIGEWINQVNDAGYAAETAASRQDNLRGDLEKLGGSFETLMIKLGSLSQGPLRAVVQGFTGLLDWVSALPQPVLNVVSVVGALTTGVGLLGGGLLVLVPRIVTTVEALRKLRDMNFGGLHNSLTGLGDKLGISNSQFAGFTRNLAKIAGATGAVYGIAKLADELLGMNNKVVESNELLGRMGSIAKNNSTYFEQMFAGYDEGFFQNFKDLATVFEDVGNWGFFDKLSDLTRLDVTGILDAKDAVTQLQDALLTMANTDIDSFRENLAGLWREAGESDEAWANMMAAMPEVEARLRTLAAQAGLTGSDIDLLDFALHGMKDASIQADVATQGTSTSLQGEAAAAGEATQSLAELIQAERDYYGAAMSADEASIKYRDTLDEINQKLIAGASASATGTAAQRENQQSLIDLADAGWAEVEALVNVGAEADVVADKHIRMTQDFISTANQMGVNGRDAVALAQKYGLIPENIDTESFFNDDGSIRDINALKAAIVSIPSNTYSQHTHTIHNKTINEIINLTKGSNADGRFYVHSATGGLIRGPGTETSDSIPVMLSNNEFVMRAAAVKKFGIEFMNQINAGFLPKFAAGGYVSATQGMPRQTVVVTPNSGPARSGGNVYIDKVINPVEEPATLTAVKQLQKIAAFQGGMV